MFRKTKILGIISDKNIFPCQQPLTINLPMMALFPPSSKIFLPDKQIIKMQSH